METSLHFQIYTATAALGVPTVASCPYPQLDLRFKGFTTCLQRAIDDDDLARR